MKIAHFVSNYPRPSGKEFYGKSLAACNLCQCLAKLGHEIIVFTVHNGKGDYFEEFGGVKIYRFGSLLKHRSEGISLKLLRIPLNFDFDIIHIHSGISVATISGYNHAKKKNTPLIVTWHGDSIKGYGRYNGIIPSMAAYVYRYHLADAILNLSRYIITPSQFYVNESVFLGRYKNKLVSIPNGVNLSEFNHSLTKEECKKRLNLSDTRVVLFVGSLYSLKGPHILLESIPNIINTHKNICFVFVGGGDVGKYEELSKHLGIAKYVRFTGYIDQNLKILYYHSADIFVLPSTEKFEVFPLVLLEASASSIPMVVSNLETFNCIIKDGYNGIITKIRDKDSISSSINYLLENDMIRETMGKNARKLVEEKYSWDIIAKLTEKLYSITLSDL
jgi:glycosyltransferase involved in cell wall biosynthesis